MPGPKPPEIVLSAEQRRELERLVSAHETAQALVRRARVVLLAAMGYSNTAIAEQVPMEVEAVGLWRDRMCARGCVSLDRGVPEGSFRVRGRPQPLALMDRPVPPVVTVPLLNGRGRTTGHRESSG
jgi:hypothetical protein